MFADWHKTESAKFQFPSNGKTETKHTDDMQPWWQQMFQFPSNGKVETKTENAVATDAFFRFNSLQTGKQIGMSRQPSAISHQQRGLLLIKNLLLLTAESRKPKAITQFPSNGKAETKRKTPEERLSEALVSIPFKRENGSKKTGQERMHDSDQWEFQFPSNGKAETKVDIEMEQAKTPEFQFPSNGKAETKQVRTFARRQSD